MNEDERKLVLEAEVGMTQTARDVIAQVYINHRSGARTMEGAGRFFAEDVLSALSAAGMAVVPVIPTPAMVEEWSFASPPADFYGLSDDEANEAWARADWEAMVRAAQEPKDGEG